MFARHQLDELQLVECVTPASQSRDERRRVSPAPLESSPFAAVNYGAVAPPAGLLSRMDFHNTGD